MPPLARFFRPGAFVTVCAIGVVALALARPALVAQAPAKTAPASPRPALPPRVTITSEPGVTIEERGSYPNKEIGVRGPDGQMLIEFGLYTSIWSPSGNAGKLLEVRRQSTGSAPRQELRGLYDLVKRRFAVPCDYSDFRPWGAVWIVTRRELKPKTPDKSYQGIYDPDAGRETFPTVAFRVTEHEKRLLIVVADKETAIFDAQGREVGPHRYGHLVYDAKLPLWPGRLASSGPTPPEGFPNGYVSATTGQLVTPVHFFQAAHFTGGAARALREGRYTFVDIKGREPRPEGYAYLSHFRDGVAAFARRVTVPEAYNQRVRGAEWGLVTVAGEESAALYEDVALEGAPVLQEGRVVVKHAGRWLAVDPRLPAAEAVVAAVPARWEPFQAPGADPKRPWGFRIQGGDTMLAPKWASVQPFVGPHAPFAVLQKRSFDGGKTKQDAYLWGLIDATGREVLAPRYVGIKPLTDHLAQVWEPSAQPRSPIGLLDLRTLQVVVPPLYDSELVLAGEDSSAIRVERRKKWWLIDPTGRELTPPYDYMGLFREGHLVVRDGERWFWLDRDLKPVHADKGYVKTTDFHKGLARVWSRKADQWGRLGGEALVNYAGVALHTFADPVGPPNPPAPPAPPEFVACICNGTGKRFREVKVEYSGSGGSALRPYTPGGGTTTTYGSYSKWEYDGVCTACNGTGKLKNLRK